LNRIKIIYLHKKTIYLVVEKIIRIIQDNRGL
jgi:hypothetical protein